MDKKHHSEPQSDVKS